jgi:hypothetical protein
MDPSMHTIHMKIDRSLVDMFKDVIGILSVAVANSVRISPKHFGREPKAVDAVDHKATVYALAQCFPCISATACNRCLNNLIGVLESTELTTIL